MAHWLVGEGKLRSREATAGSIEIWVADADRTHGGLIESLEVINDWRSAVAAERLVAAIARQVTVLTAPLTASQDQTVQLARENGALTERVASLERELDALRGASGAAERALERTRDRLEAVEEANVALTEMVWTRAGEREPQQVPAPRPWLRFVIGVVLCVAVAVLCAAAAGFWIVGRP